MNIQSIQLGVTDPSYPNRENSMVTFRWDDRQDDILAVGTTPCNYTAWCKRANGKVPESWWYPLQLCLLACNLS